MKLGLTANSEVPDAIRVSRKVLNILGGRSDIVLESSIAGLFSRDGLPIEEMDIDALITIGGDGTILRSIQRTEAPIFGINAGVLGFLTEIREAEIQEGIDRLLRGDYFIDERIKLKTMVAGTRMMDATNESVVHTAHIAKIRHFNIYVDDQLAMDVRADGIIVSTSTGSTCYAMAVGSPVIDPRMNAFVIAPMAPFKFAARPIVVPAESKVRIELARPKPCMLVVDGQQERGMEGDEMVEFSRSEVKAKFIRFERDFYKRLREKLVCPP